MKVVEVFHAINAGRIGSVPAQRIVNQEYGSDEFLPVWNGESDLQLVLVPSLYSRLTNHLWE